MAKDILITPAGGTIDFYDTSNSYNTATIGFGESQTTGALSIYHDGSGINVLNRLNTGTVFEVYGTNGTLFSLDDDLSDSLFAVANSAGLPVFEVFADNSIVGGSYGNSSFNLSANGNLGIGTTSPSFKLDVSSSPSSEPYAQALFRSESGSSPFGGIVVSGNYQAHIRFLTGTGTWGGAGAKQWQIRSGLANNVDKLSVYSWTASADVMTWNAAGNVGIGTTSPTAPLHVVGDAIINNGSPANSNMPLTVGEAGGGFATVAQFGRTGQAIYITENSPIISAGAYYNNAWVGTSTSSNFLNFAAGAFDFQIGSGSVGGAHTLASYMKLNSTGLGIGGVTPAHRLHVNGNSLVTGNTYIGDTNRYFKADSDHITLQTQYGLLNFGPANTSWCHMNTDRPYFYFNKGLTVDTGIIQSYDENLVLNAAVDAARAIEFRSGGTTYMYMTAGSLGIGTTSPGGKLHVYGGTTAFTNMADNTDSVQITRNAGVHTTHPDAKLYIYDNSSADYAQKISLAGASYGLRIDGFNNYGIELNQNSLGLVFVANSTEIVVNEIGANYDFRVEGDTDTSLLVCDASADSVGIGTASPSTKTHIYGTLTVDSSGNSTNAYTEGIRLGASSNGYSIINYGANASASSGSQAGQWWAGKHGSTGGFNFWNATSSDVLHIKLDGNVGIGTNSPTQKLHVVGNVTATAYYGDGSNLTGISTSSSSNTQSQLSGTTTLTLNVGSYALHVVPLASGTTISSITYSSAPSSGTVSSIIVILKYSGTATVTWTNVIWSGGVTPTLTGSSGKGDVFSLTSYNGGSNWIGAVIAQNLDSTNL